LKSLSSANLLVGVVGTVFILSSFFGCTDTSEPERSVLTPSVTETPEPSVSESATPEPTPSATTSEPTTSASSPALTALATIPIKGRAPKTGYDRELFASDWDYSFGCDMRNKILRRDFIEFQFRSDSSCIIATGVLLDPYTGQTIGFVRGVGTSNEVQIDHVVAVSDAWQKGAQQLSSAQRYAFYNDPLNLLAVSGSANAQKSDSDAASWLPSNKAYRCAFVARQVAVKISYNLWVTQAEHDAIYRVLQDCPDQGLPTG
jgi:Protein of unknown function (DUF1524)